MGNVVHWLEGEDRQNFGDYLTEYFMHHLFLETARFPADIRIIGSILSEDFIPDHLNVEGPSEAAKSIDRKTLIAWGGGIRELGGIRAEKRRAAEILSVRGPLSASELGLGGDVPMADPALLLPAIYTPSRHEKFIGRTICIPHFHDSRTDNELLSLTGADLILRPNIKASLGAVERFIDAINSAQFVLSAALHGAIVAAAYGRPFAFWDSGAIDLPVKWQDFSQSVQIPSTFVHDVPEGVAHYENEIAPVFKAPSVWESLAFAPFIPRPDSLLKIFVREIGTASSTKVDHAIKEKLAIFESQFEHFRQIADESLELAEQSLSAESARARLSAELQTARADRAQLAQQMDEELAALSAELQTVRADRAKQARQMDVERAAFSANLQIANAARSVLESSLSKCVEDRAQLARQMDAARAEYSAEIQTANLNQSALESALMQSVEARVRLARQLDKAFRRPWRPIKYFLMYYSLKALAAAAKPLSQSASARFRRSAKKRRPKRFQQVVAGASVMVPVPAKLHEPKAAASTEFVDILPVVDAGAAEAFTEHALKPGKHVLFIDSAFPDPKMDSGSVDTINYVSWLTSLGYNVHFLSTGYTADKSEQPVRAAGADVLHLVNEQAVVKYIQDQGHAYQLFFLSRVYCGGRFLEDCRRANPPAPVIFNTVDLQHVREEREAAINQDRAAVFLAGGVRERELYIARQSDLTIVVSSVEKDILERAIPGAHVVVMPLYREFPTHVAGFDERSGIGFVGGFAHIPNVDAIQYFLSEVWPILRKTDKNLRFEIAGSGLPDDIVRALPAGVSYRGHVPDLNGWLGKLRLTVAPLRYGAGAKGKVASSIVAGVPIVGTKLAFEGMGIGAEEAIAADTAEMIASEISRVYSDKDAWELLSRGARDFGVANLSPETGRKRFAEFLCKLQVTTPDHSRLSNRD